MHPNLIKGRPIVADKVQEAAIHLFQIILFILEIMNLVQHGFQILSCKGHYHTKQKHQMALWHHVNQMWGHVPGEPVPHATNVGDFS